MVLNGPKAIGVSSWKCDAHLIHRTVPVCIKRNYGFSCKLILVPVPQNVSRSNSFLGKELSLIEDNASTYSSVQG